MISYKELYLKMVRASEQAARVLIDAQKECEENVISGSVKEERDNTRVVLFSKQNK